MKIKNIFLAAVVGGVSLAATLSFDVVAQDPELSAYYLTGPDAAPGSPEYFATLANLTELEQRIRERKSSFNKLVLSFVQPSLIDYQPNYLACTGLFGYTCEEGKKHDDSIKEKSRLDFSVLREIIESLKKNGVETYIAVGGWNFSCIPHYYNVTAQGANACGPENEVYDSFPNPKSPDRFDNPLSAEVAQLAYQNIVKLASDLNVAGIDIDYEEFWHADLNSYSWKLTPDQVSPPASNVEYIDTNSLTALGKGGQVYNDNMSINPGAELLPRVMQDTENKFAAIIESISQSIAVIKPELKLSLAAPATGGIPNMSANWGTNGHTAYTYGGAWWGGNLYGLIYNVALKKPDLINRFSSIGIMSYDLSERDCGGDTNLPCDLAGQVEFYYSSFLNWLKSGDSIRPGHAIVKGAPTYAGASIQPAKLLITPSINVGFEVGKPATGNLVLTKDMLDYISSQSVKHSSSGMIMWDLYKDKRYDEPLNGWNDDWARPSDVLTSLCEKMGLSSDVYDCSSNILE
ncbi:toxin [Aeromonas veronii]